MAQAEQHGRFARPEFEDDQLGNRVCGDVGDRDHAQWDTPPVKDEEEHADGDGGQRLVYRRGLVSVLAQPSAPVDLTSPSGYICEY